MKTIPRTLPFAVFACLLLTGCQQASAIDASTWAVALWTTEVARRRMQYHREFMRHRSAHAAFEDRMNGVTREKLRATTAVQLAALDSLQSAEVSLYLASVNPVAALHHLVEDRQRELEACHAELDKLDGRAEDDVELAMAMLNVRAAAAELVFARMALQSAS